MYKIFLVILVIILFIILFNNVRQNFISINKQFNEIVTDNNRLEQKISESYQDNNLYREEILSESPKIVYLHNFITQEEAEHFIAIADKNKRPSTINTDDNPTALMNDVRSSESAHVGKSSDSFVSSVENKAVKYMSSIVDNLEPLQIVVYEKGQKYIPHYDFFTPDTEDVKIRGNRCKTILVYLNDVQEEFGGATFFPKINLKVQPKGLDAIYFENMNNDNVDYNTLHSGEPILGDVKKYAINIWLRERKF